MYNNWLSRYELATQAAMQSFKHAVIYLLEILTVVYIDHKNTSFLFIENIIWKHNSNDYFYKIKLCRFS